VSEEEFNSLVVNGEIDRALGNVQTENADAP